MGKTLLLLEGGGYRGIFPGAVLDVFLEQDLYFDAVAGISVGSLCGYNFISRDHGRVRRILMEYGNDPRYFSVKNLVRNGRVMGNEFMFGPLMQLVPFDYETFHKSETVFAVGATNCSTGKCDYFEKGKVADFDSAVLASCSLPLSGKKSWVEGQRYLDGGIAEHAPLGYLQSHPEYDRAVLVLTRPLNARKFPVNPAIRRAYRAVYRHDPILLDLLLHEAEIFNAQRLQIARLQKAGKLFLIGPDRRFRVNRVERDRVILEEGYILGREEAERRMPELLTYLEQLA